MFVVLEDIKKRYHIRNFLEQQEEVLEHLLNEGGKSNILYMATAARGKTLPPLIATLENKRKKPKKMTLWFVPTIALAHDLMKRIEKKGNYGKIISGVHTLRSMRFTGETVEDKKRKKISIAKNGKPDLLIISPESLKDPAFLAWLITGGEDIGLIVVDEAHLFDEWGITFRRAYFIVSWLIRTLREQNKLFKVIALSASLPQEKEDVVKKCLLFGEEDTFSSRPNTLRIGPKIVCHSHKNKSEKRRLLIRLFRKNIRRKQNGLEKKGVIFSPYKSEGYRGMKLEWSVENIRNTIIPILGLRNEEYEVYTGGTNPDERERILLNLA